MTADGCNRPLFLNYNSFSDKQMRREYRHIAGILTAVLMVLTMLSFTCPAFADEAAGRAAERYARPRMADHRFVDKEPDNCSYIGYPFLDTKNKTYTWEFPYSDDFFRGDPGFFSLKMAQGSLGLALSAFKSSTGIVDPQYETYLQGAGFTNLYAFGYDTEPTKDSLSGVIGMRQIDDFTVIASVTCGQGYGKEWAGNLEVGDDERHYGFEKASEILESNIAKYISDNNIEGKKKLWFTGMSRAAAVANLAAADSIVSREYDAVYAYLFGVPRTTRKPVRYSGIYNICGQYDPVAETPFQSWGYERYGTDLYTPAQESDVDYHRSARAASVVGDKIDDDGFRNNPEVNYQLRLIMEALNELFETSAEYTERLQPVIIDAMNDPESERLDILTRALDRVVPEDIQEKKELKTFVNYMSYIAAQHTSASQRQVDDGSWNPDDPVEANVVLEHRPVTYVKWLFSRRDPRLIFTENTLSHRISFIGNMDVEVFRAGTGISAINSRGEVYIPGDSTSGPGKGEFGTFLMRNGSETVLSLPATDDYTVIIKAPEDMTISVFDIFLTPRRLKSRAGTIYLGRVQKGSYEINVKAFSLAPAPAERGDGECSFTSSRFRYSPAVVMGNELDATKGTHMSLSLAYRSVMVTLTVLAVMLIACMVIAYIHRKGLKAGHEPYSDWFVIAPHLLCIIILAILTQTISYYLFTIESVRAIAAAATVFAVFLLALRGAIRSKEPGHFLVAAFMLLGALVTKEYYNALPIDTFSVVSAVIFFAVVALLSVIAVRMFHKATEEEKENYKWDRIKN